MQEDKVIPDWLKERRKLPITRHVHVTREYRRETPGLADKAFNKHSKNSGHHVSPLGNGLVQVGTDGIQVRLIQGLDEPNLKRVLSAATRATIGWDPEDTSEDNADWTEMLKGGLQTALESQTVVFAVSGVSRTCTHQIVRTRNAAFHQSSQRASYLGDQPEMRIPESIWNGPREVREAWIVAIEAAHKAYRTACEHDAVYQDARFILPEGTTNFILMEYPLREFIKVYDYRSCFMFQWEITRVMLECRRVLLESIESDEVREALGKSIITSCYKTGPNVEAGTEHHCTFQGWESPEGQCPLPWAKDAARTFKPEHHNI